MEPAGPEVPLVSKPSAFTRRAERLARATSSPDGSVIRPSGHTQSKGPDADGERLSGDLRSECGIPQGPHGAGTGGVLAHGSAGPTNGFWRAADWLRCRDGRWRPVEPGTFPLAHGTPARVGRLRAYGNAINAQQAKVFIEAAQDAMRACAFA